MELTRESAEELLYEEADLLDERRLEEWLSLFTEDGYYWIPMDEGADPESEPSILYDDAETRAQRVYQLLHQPHYSQLPPSSTAHMVSNVRVEPEGESKSWIVRCNLIVYEIRPGDWRQGGLGEQRSLGGRCEYRLRHEGRWRIVLKKVVLLQRHSPLENLTFLV